MSLRTVDKFVTWNSQKNCYDTVFWRRDILPSSLTFVEGTTLPVTVSAAPALTPPLTIKQPYASLNGLDQGLGTPFEVRSLVFQDSTDRTQNANFRVRLKEIGEVREFMNREVHVRTIFGTGQQPALLREPYMFLSQHNINVQLIKISGGVTTARLFLWGAQYFPWSPSLLMAKREKSDMTNLLRKWMNRRKYVTPFWLTTDEAVSLGANAAADFTAKIGDDGPFEAFGHCVVATGAFSAEITETKTKQTLMNGVITDINGMGNSQFPTIYPTPYLIPAGYRLRMRFTNLTAATNTIDWTFFGRKIYAPMTNVSEILRETAVPTPADSPSVMVPRPL